MRTFEIHEVSQLTGLATARLRAWERRYEVVRPRRMPNGYRAYTADQVALLRAFARLVGDGERIGHLAARPREQVLARAESRSFDGSPRSALLDAVRSLDRGRLEELVAQELATQGLLAFVQGTVLPLAQWVGDQWALAKISIAAEHLASEVVLHALKGTLGGSHRGDPLVIGAGLPGERHEWGLLSALAMLQARGWRIGYLGADLPVDEALVAAWKLRPRVVAFSGSDPSRVRAALPAIASLAGRLPSGTTVAIGGAGAEPHARVLRSHGVRIGLQSFPRLPSS